MRLSVRSQGDEQSPGRHARHRRLPGLAHDLASLAGDGRPEAARPEPHRKGTS
jgi:hypothetical protein